MIFREITVLTAMCTTQGLSIDEKSGLVKAIQPNQYFNIRLETEDFGTLYVTVWETTHSDVFNQIHLQTDGLDWYDFPRIISIKLDGIVVQVDVPKYKHKDT